MAWRIVWAALAGAAALAGGSAAARPLTVEDVVKVERLGRTVVAPGGRVLLLERRLPYEQGARFDFDEYNDLFRTRLEVVDLRRPGAPKALIEHDAGTGYALGPVAPDGARVAVFRLKDDRWELGVVDLASRAVSWTGLTPDISGTGRTAAWVDTRRLVLIKLPTGLRPFALRLANLAPAISERWAATARGAPALTVVGSGAEAGRSPRDPPSELVLLDVRSGARQTLAHGAFKDLETAPSGRWIAVAEADGDIPLRPGKPIRGDYGTSKRRLRLALVEVASARLLRPCPRCDISGRLLTWSSARDALLVFARDDGAPWTAGRLLEVAASGQVRDLSSGRVSVVAGGVSELIAAGWVGGRAVAYGRPPHGGRADWWLLSAGAARRLTGELPPPPASGVAAAGDRLLVRLPDRTVVLDLHGRAVGAAPGALDLGPPPTDGPLPRYGLTFLGEAGLAGTRRTARGTELARITDAGLVPGPTAPPGAEYLAGDGAGAALLRAPGPGGADRLLWIDRNGVRHPILRLNPHLADLDRPEVRPVRHAGPEGQALTSWLVLPNRRSGAEPPPLIVWPYLNQTYAAPPYFLQPRELPTLAAAQLLAAHGYAVLLPSLPVPRANASPAEGAAAAVLAVVEAAARQPDLRGAFDSRRLGLWGHSFGGYSVAAIASQSDRFRAGVTWAAAGPNLFAKWGDFGVPRRVWPQEGLSNPSWTEDLQGDTRGPPWETPERFLAGSPMLHLGQAATPLLVAHGDLDTYPIAGSEQLFSAYQRRNADAVMVTYWGEGHILRNPAHLRDFYTRGIAWLDARLGFTPASDLASARHGPGHASSAPRPR